jgi:hypothetical protein
MTRNGWNARERIMTVSVSYLIIVPLALTNIYLRTSKSPDILSGVTQFDTHLLQLYIKLPDHEGG